MLDKCSIDEDVTGFFFARGDIYEDAAHHNAVFVGRDEDGIPRYAHSKGTAGNFRLDVKGSDKAFNFCYRGEGDRLFVFEAPVDLLSFLCLFKKAWQKQSYLSLGGVGEKALLRFLSDRPNIKTVYLCDTFILFPRKQRSKCVQTPQIHPKEEPCQTTENTTTSS